MTNDLKAKKKRSVSERDQPTLAR